jgi:hypothetical protein
MLLSSERQELSHTCTWRLYDLGLQPVQLRQLKERFPWCQWETFDFASYPDHVRVEANSYAWKPLLIARNLNGNLPVFWFDSATLFHSDLEPPLATIARNGIWTLKSRSPLYRKCDPSVLSALKIPTEVLHVTERAAGALGIDPKHAAAAQIIRNWARLALQKDIILPPNSVPFHKQDQAIFNCLLLTATADEKLALTEDEIDISSPSPARDITTRNRLPSNFPLWAVHLARIWFAIYKAADQANHRWQGFHATKLKGLHRRWKEHFSVHIVNPVNQTTRAIPSPVNGYYTEPFIWIRDGRTWLFMQEFQYLQNKGRLVVMELSPECTPVSVRPLTFPQFHGRMECQASFPFVFEINGTMHMIPETTDRRSVDLYVCETWPYIWRLKRRLLFDLDAAGTMTFFHKGYWWLFTSVKDANDNRHLEIYFTESLEKGELKPHPQNLTRPYADQRSGMGRNAGYLAPVSSDRICRLTQNSTARNREGVAAMVITHLTQADFRERPADPLPELPMIVPGFRGQHVSQAGHLFAYGIKRRAR